MLTRPILSAFACILFAHGFAQDNVQQSIFNRISEKDGLSNNIVNCIVRDKAGFVWIGTFDGLNRFDGTHFIKFRNDRNNANSLVQNTVHGICLDSSGDIWCATETGISCYRQNTQTFENFYPGAKQDAYYTDILCDGQGTIWCASSYGLYEYVSSNRSFRQYGENDGKSALTSNAIYKKGLVLSPDKRSLWIATVKGINQFDIKSKKFFNYKNNPQKLALFDSLIHYPVSFDRHGKLVYGANLLYQYDFSTNTVTSLDVIKSSRTPAGPPNRIFVDSKNRYWISTWGYALFVYDADQKKVEEFYHDPYADFSVAANFFWDAYEDVEGTVWLGTIAGLSYTNSSLMSYRLHQPFKNSEPQSHTAIRRFFEDQQEQWWFTTIDRPYLYHYDRQTQKTDSFDLTFDKDIAKETTAINGFAQNNNCLFLYTSNAIHAFDLKTHRFDEPLVTPLKKVVNDEIIYSLKTFGDTVYLLTDRSGITAWFGKNVIRRIPVRENDFLKHHISQYKASVLTTSGLIYYCFSGLRIARYNIAKNQLDTFSVRMPGNIKIVQEEAVNLDEDASGNLWISQKSTGLIFYNVRTGETKLWQESDGLVFNHIYAISIDRNNRIWCAAYNKFSVYDVAKNRFQNFAAPLGEATYAYVSKMIHLHNGNILCNVDQTFIEGLPDKLNLDITHQPVLISSLRVFDSVRLLVPTSNIRLKHTENFFSIEFGIVTGLDKSRYHLEYMLDGINDSWMNAGPLNTATFTNVPEKQFVFKVRAVSNDNSWQGTPTELAIAVTPPFYRTTVFRIIAALMFAAFIVWLIRLRINNIRKAEQQKSEFNNMVNEWRLKALRSQMNPHFIFNCMNSIDLYILKNDPDNASKYLNKFAKLVRLILNQSDEMSISLAKELEMLKYYIELEALRFDTPFSYKIQLDDAIDADETLIPSMLLQPYVENAIWHGLRHRRSKGHLDICINKNERVLHCIIEDDGVGRSVAAQINKSRTQHKSKGTKLTEERLQMINLENEDRTVVKIVDLTNETGDAAGTRVEIDIVADFEDS